MKRNSEKARFRAGLLTLSALLVLGSGLSGIGVVFARREGHESALLWLGFLTVTLWFGALVCLGLKVLQVSENRKRRKVPPKCVSTDSQYIAEYSRLNRATAIGLTSFWGVLTAYLALRSNHTLGTVISAGFFCFSVWYAVQVVFTRIEFTKERIIARLPWSKKLSEPYRSVLRLRSKPGTVNLQFSHGRSLKLHSGLGDPDVIFAHLQAHCPDSVVSGGVPQ